MKGYKMKYSKPPLPFMGSKVAMLKRIKAVLENMQYAGELTKDTIFYDVFGGSGLIAHNIKQWYPQNKVIWNDFDNFQERLENIHKTERIRAKCYKICESIECKEALPDSIRAQVREVLEAEEYLDLTTLSAYFLFCANYAKSKDGLLKAIKYNRIAKNPLSANGYLEGVKRVSKDFLELLKGIPQEQRNGKACLILDPPYLQTIAGNYKNHFTMKQYCALFTHIFKPYIFFSSENSEILEFLEALRTCTDSGIFGDYAIDKEKLQLANAGVDYMIYSCLQKGLFARLD